MSCNNTNIGIRGMTGSSGHTGVNGINMEDFYKVIVCVNNKSHTLNLTVGKRYTSFIEGNFAYLIKDDIGIFNKFPIDFFKKLEDYRNDIIDNILE